MIHLYNSLTKKKTQLTPLVEGKLGLYVCGLTVYDQAHIGHLRCMLVFDFLVRFLRSMHIDVTYVRNITDVDDKIIKRAQEEGISTEQLTQRVIEGIVAQERKLGLVEPTHEPRASQYITQMVEMIQVLVDKGFAYVARTGDVCFSVAKYADYGQLSGQSIEALIQGHRIEGEGKQSQTDFVLWKQSKPGEPYWPSPWGDGRPGWHIECSAMSDDLLGKTFDLHGGGIDLKFPHHENERAQSVCATGGECAKHWMHVGHLHVNDEKMSKSLGNFITIEDALSKYHPELLKLFLLKTHYRQPFNYTESGVKEVQTILLNFYLAVWPYARSEVDESQESWQLFKSALADDLNIAKALSVMHQVSNQLLEKATEDLASQAAVLYAMGDVLGIIQEDPTVFLQGGVDVDAISEQVSQRQKARLEKDYSAADAIRDQLQVKGVVVEDRRDGSRWYYQYAGLRVST